ncbi:MAG: NAD-dependent epimerase/dehydratase family protein [Gammaproteobacteria bacterium]|nr:NAD-dependent epimerase/dehydratase family protein [Gammaproteobacteria bacterium]
MSKYLITGGCGFIGSHLSAELIKGGHQIRVLDNLSTGKRENLPAGCEIVVGEVTNSGLVRSCMREVDGCFHLAAMTSSKLGCANWINSNQTNLNGTINVLDAARDSEIPVVYASSSAVYGDNAELSLTEQARLRPLTNYGADKVSSELHARVANLIYGVPTTGLRFFNVYGPGQNPKLSHSSVVSIFVDRLLRDQPLHIYGDGEQIRDFIYIDDVVHFLCEAMGKNDRGPAVYNVCSGEAVSINQLARSAMSILDVNLPIVHKPSRKGDIRGVLGDPSLARQNLGVKAHYRLADGLYTFIKHEQKMRMASHHVLPSVQLTSQACFLR